MALTQVTQHPEVSVTWGSTFPDKVKFRKLVGVWPLRLKLRADYCRVSRSFEYGCSCKVRKSCLCAPWRISAVVLEATALLRPASHLCQLALACLPQCKGPVYGG